MSQELTAQELSRYSRQVSLGEIGISGQMKLKNAKVVVIGCGGLGCPALLALAAAGVGTIGIVDFDVVNLSNLNRQILFTPEDIGKHKVEQARTRLRIFNPDINIFCYPIRLSPENVFDILPEYDVVIDGSDNFATRYLVNDSCVVLGKPFVAASVFRFEGQLSVFNYMKPNGVEQGPTYRCLFPTPPPPSTIPSCEEGGVLGVVPTILGAWQASEALKMILGIGEVLSGKLLIMNFLNGTSRTLSFSRTKEAEMNDFDKNNPDYKTACNDVPAEVSLKELLQEIQNGEPLCLIDVREPFEHEEGNIGGELIPLGTLADSVDRIPRTGKVVLYCRSGKRSMDAYETLRELDYTNVRSLAGGYLKCVEEGITGDITK